MFLEPSLEIHIGALPPILSVNAQIESVRAFLSQLAARDKAER